MSGRPGGGEDRLIGWLRESIRRGPGHDLLGDDAALLPTSPGTTIATVDTQVGGVHVPEDLDAGLVAARLLHVNLSDLAAMGAVPPGEHGGGAPPWCHALVTLATPEAFDHRHFFSVLLEECAATGVTLGGGDLSSSTTLTATMTLMAHQDANWRPVRRGTARPGDGLWVGGSVGESAAGLRLLRRGARLTAHGERAHVFLPSELRQDEAVAQAARRAVRRHLVPRAQLDLGAWLGSRPEAEQPAGLDLSDGIARDLPRLTRESGVGAELEAAALPLADGFTGLCDALGADPIDLALGGGEDYVLLFALPEGVTPPARFGCRRIGRLTEGEGLVLLRDGRREEWPVGMGWDHLTRHPTSP